MSFKNSVKSILYFVWQIEKKKKLIRFSLIRNIGTFGTFGSCSEGRQSTSFAKSWNNLQLKWVCHVTPIKQLHLWKWTGMELWVILWQTWIIFEREEQPISPFSPNGKKKKRTLILFQTFSFTLLLFYQPIEKQPLKENTSLKYCPLWKVKK